MQLGGELATDCGRKNKQQSALWWQVPRRDAFPGIKNSK